MVLQAYIAVLLRGLSPAALDETHRDVSTSELPFANVANERRVANRRRDPRLEADVTG